MTNGNKHDMQTHNVQQADNLISRRALLATLGVAGAALGSTALLLPGWAEAAPGGSVNNDVYAKGPGGVPGQIDTIMTRLNNMCAINIKDYGAVGDGTTDDTEAFRNAALTGKPLIVPRTDAFYKVSGTVFIRNSIYGIGMPEIRMEGADGTVGKRLLAIASYKGSGLHVTGLHLNGQYIGGSAGEQSHLLRVTDSRHVYIHHNRFDSAYGDCIYFGSDYLGPCEDVHVYSNMLIDPWRCAVSVVSARRVWVRDNVILDGFDYVASIDIEPNRTNSGSDIVEDVWIENNIYDSAGVFVNSYNPNAAFKNKRLTIRGNQGQARYFFRCNAGDVGNTEDVSITDNIFYGSVGDARMFTTGRVRKGLEIRGNRDAGTGGAGWNIANAEAPVICNNTIEVNRLIAMSVRNCNRILMCGNTIKYVYSSYGAIRISGPEPSTGHVISHNVLVGSDYGIRFDTIVTDTVVSGNSIEAARQCIYLAPEASGSDVRIMPDNVFSGAGAPVGNYTYLRQTRTPEALAKGVSVCWANSVPTLGDWVRGSIVYKTNVSASECMGWICVASGNPGTWESFGVIGESRLVLKSPSGSRYAITVTDAGAVVTSAIV
ncbi:right-handed parallel beta-helix repeat-containing protein [Paenibacillus mesophilus]|uniref:right-handed parallel beta-helix repeat-containing protein n=1 Tax=Paenibacillus mesophilus TaxID=2582849 RepID=UPI0013050C93|nr:right-handed parallel beta-helix repeat-containing protein [Paenibacillus mesophilus]